MNILVMGKAKTGTTIISQTIAASLPGKTEYVFEPQDAQGFSRDFGGANVVAKILYNHWQARQNELLECIGGGRDLAFDKRVIIVRDPRDEMISALLYYPFVLKNLVQGNEQFNAWLAFLRRKEQTPASIPFLDMCRKFDDLFHASFTPSLFKFNTIDGGYTRFRQQPGIPHLVLKYEDFMSNRLAQLEKYLGTPLTKTRKVGDKYSQVYRTGSHDNWKRYFTPEDVKDFEKHTDYFALLGYTDWQLTPPENIPESELTGYVVKLLT